MADAYANQAESAVKNRDFKVAMELYLCAVREYENCANMGGIADCYANLGLVAWLRRGNTPEVVELYLNALKIYKDLGRNDGVAKVFQDLGSISHAAGDFGRARTYWAQAAELYERCGLLDNAAEIHAWLAKLV